MATVDRGCGRGSIERSHGATVDTDHCTTVASHSQPQSATVRDKDQKKPLRFAPLSLDQTHSEAKPSGIKTELQERFESRLAETLRRRETRAELRRQLKTARDAGLHQRHRQRFT